MSTVRVERAGPLCSITLSRPEALNAMTEQMRCELAEAVAGLEGDSAVRVVVLRGEGRAFCVGADIKQGGADLSGDWATRRAASAGWQRLLDRLESLPQVTVAVLHGHVVGGGVVLAAACDLRLASDDVVLRVPELAMGLPLPWGGIPRLVREVGLPRTRELLLTGRALPVAEAREWGLVQQVVEREALAQASADLVGRLLAVPAGTLGITRAALSAAGRDLATSWADADVMSWAVQEADVTAAAQAFAAERLKGTAP